MLFAGRCRWIALFVVVVISLNAISCEDLLELSCAVTNDCKQFEQSGVNVNCDNGKCRCMNSNESIKCSPNDLKQNNIIGGPCPCRIPNAECNESQNICYCAKNFMASVDKRRCLRESVDLNENCEMDFQCHEADHHSICDHKTKNCTCRQDFIEHNGTCISVADPNGSCKNNEDCQRYGGHVICLVETQKCTCKTGYIKALNKTECLNIVSYRENCTEDQQCQSQLGAGGACVKGKCECSDLYYLFQKRLETEDNVNVTQSICARIIEIGQYCREDRDCYHHQLPDDDQTMSCFYGECNCKWGFNSINNMECVKGGNGNILKPVMKFILLLLLAIIGA